MRVALALVSGAMVCLAADKAVRVQGPLRVINRYIDDKLDVITPRPVTNKPTAVLSMVGKMMTVEDLDNVESYEALVDEIANDLCSLLGALTPPPETDADESAGAQA